MLNTPATAFTIPDVKLSKRIKLYPPTKKQLPSALLAIIELPKIAWLIGPLLNPLTGLGFRVLTLLQFVSDMYLILAPEASDHATPRPKLYIPELQFTK